MAEGVKQWHQFVLDDAEMQLIQTLRDKDPEEEDPSAERIEKLSCTVELTVSVGDRYLGDYPVEGINIIANCAEVGAKIQRTLVSQEWIDGANAQDDDYLDVVEQQDHIDEASLQLANGETPDETTPWDEVRSEIIPSYVQNVTFTVSKSDLTDHRRKELENQFPSVKITEATTAQSLSGSNRSAKRQSAPEYPLEKPNGIKTAVFQLDRDAISKDDALEATIRKQYPWATIAPGVDVPPEPRALREQASMEGVIENHLQQFTSFMTDYPPDGLFDFNIPRDRTWSILPLTWKLRIAHARVIQISHYGVCQTPARHCENCKRNNYTCRVYRNDFIEKAVSTNHLNLGHGCQHCRLLGVKCDILQQYLHSSLTPPGNDLDHTGSLGIRRECPMDFPRNTTNATPQTSHQPSLADWTNKEHLSAVTHTLSGKLTKESDISDLAKSLDLNISRPGVLWCLYKTWKATGEIRAFRPGRMNLQHYYVGLVDLNVVARNIGIPELEYATLLQFQLTNFERHDQLPDINKSVIRAFEHLPTHAPLCRWIAIVFSYKWSTVEAGDYESFLKKNIELDPLALNKLLYGIAYIRDSHTEGGEKAVLQQWCTVHDHVPGSADHERCMNAERACKHILELSGTSLNQADNARKPSNKRAYDESSGVSHGKKYRQNDGYQYGLTSDSRASATKEQNTECGADDGTHDASSTSESSAADEINIGRQSLRSAGSDKRQADTSDKRTVTRIDPPRRRGRPPKNRTIDVGTKANPQSPKQSPISSNDIAAVLNYDHLDSLPDSEFNLSKALDDQNTNSTTASTENSRPQTPQRSMAQSEEPTSERRSARVKPPPPGYFQQRPKKREFRNTMWDKFKI